MNLRFRAGVYGFRASEASLKSNQDAERVVKALKCLQVMFAHMEVLLVIFFTLPETLKQHQDGRHRVFDPTELIKLLQIQSGIQQDATVIHIYIPLLLRRFHNILFKGVQQIAHGPS